MSTEPERLRRVFGAAELGRLVDRLVRRLALDQPLDGVLTLDDVTAAERRAIERLLGRRPGRGSSLTVSLPGLERALRRAGLAPDLRTAVETVAGPVQGRTQRLAAEDAARETALAAAGRRADERWYAAWLDEVAADGTLTRLLRRGEAHLLGQVAAVLDRLDAVPRGTMPLSVLAERACGNTKALSGTPLAGLVLRALASREGSVAPANRAGERTLWEAAGVIVDDLTSQVLVLNLPADGKRTALASWLAGAAGLGVPFRITLHQLVTMPLALEAATVFVCENPAVLRSAVARWGPTCAPLVCTEGVPSLACHRLLADAASDGVRIRWRGDFDWTGLRTTATAIGRYAAAPWRMGLSDYEAALSAGESEPLRGAAAASPWDEALTTRMSQTGRAVMEERLIPLLLADLGP